MKAEVPKKMVTGVIFTVAAIVAGFVFTSPLTYGSPGLDVEAVNRRRILESWTLVSRGFPVSVMTSLTKKSCYISTSLNSGKIRLRRPE